LACKKGDIEAVQILLTSPEILINAQDNNLWTPLHEASNAGHVEIVRTLLEYNYKGKGVPCVEGRTTIEQTPFADVSSQSLEGITPLHDAVLCGQLEVVKLLLEDKRGQQVFLSYDSPSVRSKAAKVVGGKTSTLDLQIPSVVEFAENGNPPEMKNMLQKKLQELLLSQEEQQGSIVSQSVSCSLPPLSTPSIASSSNLDESQASECHSQNFCPTDSQYEDVFQPPTPPATISAFGEASASSSAATISSVSSVNLSKSIAARCLFSERQKSTASSPTFAMSNPLNSSPFFTKQALERMVKCQLLLLTNYLKFWGLMETISDNEVAAPTDAETYGDARIIRRLPKHLRSLRRHAIRLSQLCEARVSQKFLSDDILLQLEGLEKLFSMNV